MVAAGVVAGVVAAGVVTGVVAAGVVAGDVVIGRVVVWFAVVPTVVTVRTHLAVL